MESIVLGVIIHEGRIVIQKLTEEVRPDFRGVPAVMPGGRVKDKERPEDAVVRKIKKDLGIDVLVEGIIATREHPLIPGSSVVYYFCTVMGSSKIQNKNKEKASSVQWVDIATAIILMLTLYSQVLAFLIRHIYGKTLPQNVTLPKLEWLSQDISGLGKKVREGELVAFPTETVYGIGADAFNASAVARIFEVKNRPADNPLIVHVFSLEAIERVAFGFDELSSALVKRFMPGPITVLLAKNNNVPSIVTAGSPYVGVRIPSHGLALEFLSASAVPVAAPSANKSGKPSATHHDHVIEAFGEQLPNVLRAGKTVFGLESTVVLPQNNERLVIMRQGAISQEELQKSFPHVEVAIATSVDLKHAPTPGSKYRHYAPTGKVEVLPLLPKNRLVARVERLYRKALSQGETVAILCTTEVQQLLPTSFTVLPLGSEKKMNAVASNLYSTLIECDARRITKILIQSFSEKKAGRTIMERIRRASEIGIS